ncbi:MAG TPA: hypothetical protein VIH99_09125 [Bdellovibrionota bacterium]|jgi:hypothetical protein
MKLSLITAVSIFLTGFLPMASHAYRGESQKCAEFVLNGPHKDCSENKKFECGQCMNHCPHVSKNIQDCDRGCPAVCGKSKSEAAAKKQEYIEACVKPAKEAIKNTYKYYDSVRLNTQDEAAMKERERQLSACEQVAMDYNVSGIQIRGPGPTEPLKPAIDPCRNDPKCGRK